MNDPDTARGALSSALSGVLDADALDTLTRLVQGRFGYDGPAREHTTREVLATLVGLLREESGGHAPRVWLRGETPPADTVVLAATGDILRWTDEDAAAQGGTAGRADFSPEALSVALVEVCLPDWREAVDCEVIRRATAFTRTATSRPVPPVTDRSPLGGLASVSRIRPRGAVGDER